MKKEPYPGLAMSRSIGDLIASSIGVIAEPDILEYTITNNSCYVILASDGIWEFLNNFKVMNISTSYYNQNNPDGMCKKVIIEATKAWESDDIVIDDITIITAFF